MTEQQESAEVPFNGLELTQQLFSGAESPPEKEEAAAGELPSEEIKSSEDSPSTDDPDGDSAKEDKAADGKGKKAGRFQKLKQRAQAAEKAKTELEGKAHEALDIAQSLESENKALGEELQSALQRLEDAGLGYSDEELELREYKLKERRDTFQTAAQKAAAERAKKHKATLSQDQLKDQIVESASEAGLDWRDVGRYMLAFSVDTDKAVEALKAARATAKGDSDAVKQAQKNKLAPAVMKSADGDSTAASYKLGSLEHVQALFGA